MIWEVIKTQKEVIDLPQHLIMAVLWLRQLRDFSLWMPKFSSRIVHVGFVVDKEALG
jgi:hypothetical protein